MRGARRTQPCDGSVKTMIDVPTCRVAAVSHARAGARGLELHDQHVLHTVQDGVERPTTDDDGDGVALLERDRARDLDRAERFDVHHLTERSTENDCGDRPSSACTLVLACTMRSSGRPTASNAPRGGIEPGYGSARAVVSKRNSTRHLPPAGPARQPCPPSAAATLDYVPTS